MIHSSVQVAYWSEIGNCKYLNSKYKELLSLSLGEINKGTRKFIPNIQFNTKYYNNKSIHLLRDKHYKFCSKSIINTICILFLLAFHNKFHHTDPRALCPCCPNSP